MSDSDFCALPLTEWVRLRDGLAAAGAERDRLRAVLLGAHHVLGLLCEPDHPVLAEIEAALAKEPQP